MKDSIIITSKKYNSIEFYKSKTNFKKAEKFGIKFLNFPYTLRLIRAESTNIKKSVLSKNS